MKSLAVKVLEDLSYFQPVPEAGQTLISDLLPAFVRDHLAVLLHNHQLGHGCDVVPLLQLAEIKQTEHSGFTAKAHVKFIYIFEEHIQTRALLKCMSVHVF